MGGDTNYDSQILQGINCGSGAYAALYFVGNFCGSFECINTGTKSVIKNWDEIMSLRDKGVKEFYKEAIDAKDADIILKLNKALAATPKMFDDYKRIKESYEEEKTKKKGTKISSLSDSDEI